MRGASVTQTARGPVEYELIGAHGPVVLASHGGVGGVDQGRLLHGWLDPARYRLLSVSRPGYLRTPLRSGRSPEDQADLFAALLDSLGIDRVAVVTLSSGGPAGYLLAARHPRRVAALIAIASVTGDDPPHTAGRAAQALYTSRPGQALMRTLARRKPAWLLRQLLASESLLDRRQIRGHTAAVLASPAALTFLRAFIDTLYPYAPRKTGTDNDSEHLRRLIRLPVHELRCPALIVHGTHDADVPIDHGIYAHEHIDDARRHWIDQGSHLGFWLGPGAPAAQAAARAFLDRLQPW